jgi:azurin/glucose/arabinose dehydrogenase/lysophospholipase L1-like esterase
VLFSTLRRLLLLLCSLGIAAAQSTLVFNPPPGGPARPKHVVLLSGDEEYRSEEALPMLAKILSQRHGFKCTVLFALDPDGTINPANNASLPGAAELDSADLILMSLRFRAWPAEAMQHFIAAYQRGTPIVALRTSTHAFNYPRESPFAKYTWNSTAPWAGGWGRHVLGETWVTHWGKHKVQATRGVVEAGATTEAVMRGVKDIFGTTDVYEAQPPADVKILVRGQVLTGMAPTDGPADTRKKRARDQVEQAVNEPAMPIAWTRLHQNDTGKENRIFCTTMGAATDLENEGLRRLVINAVYWGLNLEIPGKADVRYVDPYSPRMYGMGNVRHGLKPSDYALGKTVREGAPPPAAPGAAKKAGAGLRPPPSPARAPEPAGPPLKLNPGEHVALIGNTLADRMQHHGWLESMITAKFPGHDLVFRNLAAAGDELQNRARSKDFGTPEDWLTHTRADVVFAFFGFNESFAGPAGLPKFKQDLETFLRETRAKNFNGVTPPRVVLFSPIANEKHPDPNFAVPEENNRNLALYTAAMAEVAGDRAGVIFVDLFTPSQRLYNEAARQGRPLTHNGLHLTEAGEAVLAPVMFQGMFSEAAPTKDLTKLRAVINEKNAMWHSRYRTVDGYNVYGGRSMLTFAAGDDRPKISNFEVMQEEMTQRDVLTANRDRRVWAVAKGGDLVVDDSNLPPVTPVPTNKPGANPDGSHPFLGAEEAIARMTLSPGLKANLFASEEQFPELINPVQMAWDARGRLWVAVWPNYPERTPDSKKGDSLLIFEDTDGDGRADKCTHFLDDLNCPTGFQLYKDGVLIVQAPDLWFVRDTDGDGRGDSRERILMGLDSADSHHTSNSLAYEPGGALFLSDGVFHRTQVETATGPVRNIDGAIFRFEPATGKFETYVSFAFANPHGRTFDRWGNDLIVDATGNRTFFGPAFSGRLDYPAKHATLKQIWNRPSRPSAASMIITSRHFPAEFQGNYLNSNVIGFQGIYRVKLVDDGAGLEGERLDDFVSSTDPNFRPVSMSVGADGAVYFLDWHNAIIGHMQHHIRDPNRDHAHGRIYRVTHEGRPLLQAPKIHDQPIPALLALLKEPENHIRELAKIELGRHDPAAVIAGVKTWLAGLDRNDPVYSHHLTEALWVHQWQNRVDPELLQQVLRSPDANARAAATRVLCYWRDRVPNTLPLLKGLAADENARVRLQAVRAASFFRENAAVDVALTAIKHPMDYYIDYTLGETLKQLKSLWREQLGDEQALSAGDPARVPFLLRTVTVSELLRLPKSNAVLEQMLKLKGVPAAARREALDTLVRARQTTATEILLAGIEKGVETDVPSVGHLLLRRPAAELAPARERLRRLATDETLGARAYGWAGQVLIAGAIDPIWDEAVASKSHNNMVELMNGIALLPDAALRATAYPRIAAIAEQAPDPALPPEHARWERRAAIRALASTRQEPEAQFKILSRFIQQEDELQAAALSMRALPKSSWAAAEVEPTVKTLLKWAKTIPASGRSAREYLETVQITDELIASLPAETAEPYRKQLRSLRVTVYLVRTLPEQMKFDTSKLVVKADQGFQVLFENPDAMPHNFVVVKPGTRERVGMAAMTMSPEKLDAAGRAYVPDTSDVIAATTMVDAGQNETLRVPALAEGVYEFVCTFPGHWTIMWGQLVVTNNPDSVASATSPPSSVPAAPTAPPAAHAHGK